MRQGTGVGALRKRFGGSYRFVFLFPSPLLFFVHSFSHFFCFALFELILLSRRGALPNIHQDAAGGIIRSIILSLDELKVTEKCGKGVGILSRIGHRALDQFARHVALGEA